MFPLYSFLRFGIKLKLAQEFLFMIILKIVTEYKQRNTDLCIQFGSTQVGNITNKIDKLQKLKGESALLT